MEWTKKYWDNKRMWILNNEKHSIEITEKEDENYRLEMYSDYEFNQTFKTLEEAKAKAEKILKVMEE